MLFVVHIYLFLAVLSSSIYIANLKGTNWVECEYKTAMRTMSSWYIHSNGYDISQQLYMCQGMHEFADLFLMNEGISLNNVFLLYISLFSHCIY